MDGLEVFVIIFIVLFPMGYIVHEVEEIIFQRRWVLKNAATLKQRLPKLAKVFDHLLTLDTKAFAFAVIEETIVIALAIILPIYLRMNWTLILFGILSAYTLHLLVHIIQGCLIRRYVPGMETAAPQNTSLSFFTYIFASIIYRHYVPGLATACVLFPLFVCFIYLYVSFFYNCADAPSLLLAGLAGACFLLVNLLFSHWLGKKISSLFK